MSDGLQNFHSYECLKAELFPLHHPELFFPPLGEKQRELFLNTCGLLPAC